MQIGDITFATDDGRLQTRDGKEIYLRPQAKEILGILVDAGGTVVSKDRLLADVWPNTLVGEESLYQCISEIRRVLEDDQHKLLRTVPRKGYQLVIGSTRSGAARLPSREPIRFVQSRGARIAWSAIGAGIPILKAPSWISNIETEATSQLFGPFYTWIAERARFVHFDQRGSSHSSRDVADWSVDAMVDDMAAVADAAGLESFFIYGPSQGAAFAIAFAARHPERVRGIVARGAFATGWKVHGDAEQRRRYEVSRTLMASGWNEPNPEYRRFFTGLLVPNAPPEMAREMDELQARAVDAKNQLANLELQSTIDVRALLETVTCPVLLLHASGDLAIPVQRSIEIAERLASCDLQLLDGTDHIPVPGTTAHAQFIDVFQGYLDRHAV